MNLGLVMEYLYPSATIGDYEVRYDREIGYFSYWNDDILGPEPTEESLQAAWLPARKASKEIELIATADAEEKTVWAAEIEFKYVLVKRILGQPVSAQQQAKAQRVLAIFNKLEGLVGQVRRATTEAELENISWD